MPYPARDVERVGGATGPEEIPAHQPQRHCEPRPGQGTAANVQRRTRHGPTEWKTSRDDAWPAGSRRGAEVLVNQQEAPVRRRVSIFSLLFRLRRAVDSTTWRLRFPSQI